MSFWKKNPHSIMRRQFYINKDFQTRFIVKFFMILVLGGGITIGLTLFNTHGTLTSSYADSKLTIQNTSIAIMPSVIYTTLITTGIIGLVAIIVTLLVSHKIAGPMYRFEKDIQRVASGDLKSHIHIRKGDQFQETASSLNLMIDKLNNNISQVRNEVSSLANKEDLPEGYKHNLVRVLENIDSKFTL